MRLRDALNPYSVPDSVSAPLSSDRKIRIEVVLALATQQELRNIAVPPGTTVADAIRMSGIAAAFPQVQLDKLSVGVWGKVVDRSRLVLEGDRIEFYRPLPVDPRQARRQIAVEGGHMGNYETESGES